MAIKKTIAGEADTWQFFVLQETHVLFLLPIAFILTTIWTFYHFKNSFHLAFGFILAALSIIVLMQVPEAPKPNHINYLYTFGFLMAFSEILIVPVVLSAVVKYVPSRYAATWIGFSFLAPFLISYLVNNINDILKVEFYIPIEFNLKSNFTIYFLTGSAILVYYLFSRKKEPNKK